MCGVGGAVLVCLIAALAAVMAMGSHHKCSRDPPFIYVTTHDEVPNILKYSLDGCLIDDSVLLPGGPSDDFYHFTEYRSMALGKYKDQQEALFVADAMSKESFLLVYSECDANGKRHFLDTVVSTEINAGADHTYGICFDGEGNVIASFQHTDVVLRFKRDTFEPMELPPSLYSIQLPRHAAFFPGTFMQFGDPGVHDTTEQGIRGLVRINDTLWVANENIGGVAIVNMHTGMMNNIISIKNPIGLHYDDSSGLVFAGSKDKHWRGAVYAISPSLLRIVKTYTTNKMNHPTGITSHGDMLFVGEQIRGDIMIFSISSQKFLGNLLTDGPGEIEQLIMSPC